MLKCYEKKTYFEQSENMFAFSGMQKKIDVKINISQRKKGKIKTNKSCKFYKVIIIQHLIK